VNIAGSPSANTFKPFNDEKYELAIKELRKQDAFEPIVAILSEIQMSSILNKGLGRQSLVKRLEAKSQDFPDHKIRHWLKMLDEMGYVDSGVTRQGSKITKQGEEFLEYLRRSRTS
jgi:repressor of nif and glnA expression